VFVSCCLPRYLQPSPSQLGVPPAQPQSTWPPVSTTARPRGPEATRAAERHLLDTRHLLFVRIQASSSLLALLNKIMFYNSWRLSFFTWVRRSKEKIHPIRPDQTLKRRLVDNLVPQPDRFLYTHIYTSIYTRTHTHAHVHVRTLTISYIHIYIYTYIHIYIYTYIYI
jgi:hypothetical protein